MPTFLAEWAADQLEIDSDCDVSSIRAPRIELNPVYDQALSLGSRLMLFHPPRDDETICL